jgi:hypothetical protein
MVVAEKVSEMWDFCPEIMHLITSEDFVIHKMS